MDHLSFERSPIANLAFATLNNASPLPLSDDSLVELHSLFGQGLSDSLALMESCRVICYEARDSGRKVYKICGCNVNERFTLYRDVNYCRCDDFRGKVLAERSALTCKHVLALKLILSEAEVIERSHGSASARLIVETVNDSQIVDFLNEQVTDC